MSSVIDPIIVQTRRPVASSKGWVHHESGYCLWEFRDEHWSLKRNCCKEGYVPSEPPAERGRFQGQIRALTAVPRGSDLPVPLEPASA